MKQGSRAYLGAYVALCLGLAVAACAPSGTSPAGADSAGVAAGQDAPAPDPAPAPAAEPGASAGADAAGSDAVAETKETAQDALAGEDTCGKAGHAALVGKRFDAAGVPAASGDIRHIHPDTQVTMDFRPDRLNIEINADGVITGMTCG